MPSGFIVFQGRLLGTSHIVTIAPPRADGGKHIVEARVAGGTYYVEEYEDPQDAMERYMAVATELLDDPSPVTGRPATARLAQVTQLPSAE